MRIRVAALFLIKLAAASGVSAQHTDGVYVVSGLPCISFRLNLMRDGRALLTTDARSGTTHKVGRWTQHKDTVSVNWHTELETCRRRADLLSGDSLRLKVWSRTFMVDDHGVFRFEKRSEYYPGGKIKFKVDSYLKGKPYREAFSSFYECGQLQERIVYDKSRRNGRETAFYENGRLRHEGRWRRGDKVGRWVFYDTTGKAIKTDRY